MKSFGHRTGFGRAVLAGALGVALAVGWAGSAAHAEDDDDDNASFDTKIVRHILQGLGLKRDEANIEYRERPPLVLPAAKDLPPPEPNNPATKTAGWPDDPDVKLKKQRKDAEAKRKPYVEGVDDRPMLPSEYSRPGSGSPSNRPSGPGRTAEDSAKPSSQAELGAKNVFNSLWAPKEEYATFTGEPARGSLTEPPAGYRTPSPNQPYGLGKEKWKPPVIDRQEPAR